jgi:hypothetical protein
MRIGDVSRPRRSSDPIRQRWYARYRAIRFARRMRSGSYSNPTHDATPAVAGAHA